MGVEDRRMKYPYTYVSKLWNFPIAYYYKHAFVFRYYPLGMLFTLPVMWKITKAVNSPENKAKWAEIRRKQFAGEH